MYCRGPALSTKVEGQDWRGGPKGAREGTNVALSDLSDGIQNDCAWSVSIRFAHSLVVWLTVPLGFQDRDHGGGKSERWAGGRAKGWLSGRMDRSNR